MYLNNKKNIGYFNTFIIQMLHCIHIHPSMYGKKLCSLLTCSQSDLLHLSGRFEGVEFLGTEAPDFDTRAAEGSGQETGVIRNTH